MTTETFSGPYTLYVPVQGMIGYQKLEVRRWECHPNILTDTHYDGDIKLFSIEKRKRRSTTLSISPGWSCVILIGWNHPDIPDQRIVVDASPGSEAQIPYTHETPRFGFNSDQCTRWFNTWIEPYLHDNQDMVVIDLRRGSLTYEKTDHPDSTKRS